MTRREALKKTVLFSTSLLAGSWLARSHGATLQTAFEEPGLNLLAMGDFGSKNDAQRLVARQMAEFAAKLKQPLDGVLALGDNFYGTMKPERFQRDFEEMYDAKALGCPFYACLGNHDYEPAKYGRNPEPQKVDVELEYARENPNSRWKMPAKWYALELPNAEAPLLKIIVMDSNLREGDLTPQEKVAQKRWLEAELAKGTKAPWLWLMWHHPVFTQTTKRKDNPGLLRMVDEALKTQPFSICISGHDHNLQHLQMEGYKPSFVVSGAGGANGYEVTPSARGFAQMTLGFNHFHVSRTRIRAQFVNANGECLHAFQRGLDGKVTVG